MPLRSLDLNYTYAADLWPLHDLPLTKLLVDGHYATDLRPLAGLPLRELQCRFRRERHSETLRSLKALQMINGRATEDFWQSEDARRVSLEPWIKRVSSLPGAEQVLEVAAKLRELNPSFNDLLHPKIVDGQVVHCQVFVNDITDIAPMRAFTRLEQL